MIDTLFVAVISLLLKSGLCVSFASVQGKENHCPMSCVEAETFYGASPVYVDCASVLYAVLYLLLPYIPVELAPEQKKGIRQIVSRIVARVHGRNPSRKLRSYGTTSVGPIVLNLIFPVGVVEFPSGFPTIFFFFLYFAMCIIVFATLPSAKLALARTSPWQRLQ